MKAVVLNDVVGTEIPLMRLDVSELTTFMDAFADKRSIDAELKLTAKFFNDQCVVGFGTGLL